MNHAVEYFHTLVEHEFTRDQYEVSFNEGKYHCTITIPDNGKNPHDLLRVYDVPKENGKMFK